MIANFKLANWMSIDQIPYASCIWKCNDFSTGTPKIEIIMARFYSLIAVNEFVKRFKEGVRIDTALQKSGEELLYPENEVRGVKPHSKKGFRGKVPPFWVMSPFCLLCLTSAVLLYFMIISGAE